MIVGSEHLTALRAALDGDEATFERLTSGADEEHLLPLSVLLAMAFSAVVRMRFPDRWSPADVIRFVAWVRVQNGNSLDDFSPSVAEALLPASLRGMPVRGEFDDAATAYTQAALLRALTGDLDEQQTDVLFGYACQQANQWLQKASSCQATADQVLLAAHTCLPEPF